MKLEIDKIEKTIKVIPESDFWDVRLSRPTPYFHLRYTIEKTQNTTTIYGFAFFYKDFGGRKYYPREIEIQNVTATEITLSYK